MIRPASSASPVRVLVVDDSPSFRDAARTLIEVTAGFACVGDASCGEDGVAMAAQLKPDLVLLDVRMPGLGGLQAARTIASNGWAGAVVLITGEDLLDAAPAGGAAEILPKRQLNPVSLRRLWSQHGKPRAGADAPTGRGADSGDRAGP
jgi:DNA-binding NarL/FixJ family response regulator